MPAITLASAAPAFAESNTPEAGACRVAEVLPLASWTSTGGRVERNVDTGWYVRGEYADTGHDGHVTKKEADWYDYLNLPDGSFLSFGNTQNAVARLQDTNAMTTVVLEYAFEVTGRVEIDLVGKVLFGYGSASDGVTERQLVDITLVGLVGGDRTVAKMAPRRQNVNGTVRYPNGTSVGMGAGTAVTAANHRLLKHTDQQVAGLGYDLYAPPAGSAQGRFVADFAERGVVDDAVGARTLRIRYTLTLPARYDTSWVNDDVILFKPTVTVCN